MQRMRTSLPWVRGITVVFFCITLLPECVGLVVVSVVVLVDVVVLLVGRTGCPS